MDTITRLSFLTRNSIIQLKNNKKVSFLHIDSDKKHFLGKFQGKTYRISLSLFDKVLNDSRKNENLYPSYNEYESKENHETFNIKI